VTHGLHPYKGKFYPQLAKGLLNLVGVADGSKVLDPFCGSGTTLLECRLNGLQAFGCDLHPLAAKVASAKIGILDIAPNSITESVDVLANRVAAIPPTFPRHIEQLPENSLDEIFRWFPERVVYKLDWLLGHIRATSTGVVTDFLEIILSSIIREISQQDPSDLRIRRRKRPLKDSDVLGLFQTRLIAQMERLQRFWSIRGFCPYRMHPAHVVMGDSRDAKTFESMGIERGSVDLVLTSPPYATALPYIDTDRLSLLVLFGMSSKERRPLEEDLTGSREIQARARRILESEIESRATGLPVSILDYVRSLHNANRRHSPGFRRRNLPSLLLRFFRDIQQVFLNCRNVLHSKGEALIVIGDNYTMVNRVRKRIPTTDFLVELAEEVGLRLVESIPITVTTENLKHTKNAITRNTVLRLGARKGKRRDLGFS
jgi:DNA modification methylase